MQQAISYRQNGLSDRNSISLYIIRTAAAEAVLTGHLFSFLGLTFLKDNTYFPYIQSLAVLVFFLLSGLLTDASVLSKSAAYSYKEFIKGRFLRIYWFYLPALLFVLLLDSLDILYSPDTYSYYSTFQVETFVSNVLMLPVLFEPFGSARPLWTLYLEWWLYIIYGYLVLVFGRKIKDRQLKIWHVLILLALICVPFYTESKMPLLAFILGVVINREYKRLPKVHMLSILILVIAFIAWSAIIKNAYHITEVLLLALILLLILAWGNDKTGKCGMILPFLSGCTFPLYLMHYTMIEFVLHRFKTLPSWSTFFLCVITCNAFSVLFYWGIKKISDRKGARLNVIK